MRPKLVSLFAISALALVGCSSAGSTPVTPSSSTVSVAPTASASESHAVTQASAASEDPELFKKGLDFMWQGEQPYSENELSNAAHDACEQLRDGARTDTVQVDLEGITSSNAQALSSSAQGAFCSDTIGEPITEEDLPERIKPVNP